MSISFIPSQIGVRSQTPMPIYAVPHKLLWADMILCASKYAFFLGIFRPWRMGEKSDPYDELYLSATNIKSVILHTIMFITQSIFLLSLPFFLILPVSWLLVYLFGSWVIHHGFYYLLNGSTIKVEPNAHIIPKENHDSEYWIYLNGVSVGKDWMQSNVDRLSLTFGRRVHGVLNPTDGIIFDLIQCLIQRNLQYATRDIREAYGSLKGALYDEKIKKVVFILHSQGGLEGSLIIDWLLAEVPQTHLRRLEVYTFGCAANHFNNPTRVDTASSSVNGLPNIQTSQRPLRAIGHIEHYANAGDYVSQIGVLNYVSLENRFMGRVFISPSSGHLLNQHYLHDMFALGPDGRCLDTNPFMEMPIDQDASEDGAEGRESFGDSMTIGGGEVKFIGDSITPISPLSLSSSQLQMTTDKAGAVKPDKSAVVKPDTMRVKNLSRLWLYRNGGVPPDVKRVATV